MTGDIVSADLNDRQVAALRIVAAAHGPNSNFIGLKLRRMGLTKNNGPVRTGNHILPAEAILRGLERRGLVRYSRSGRDQWAVKVWYLTPAGEEIVKTLLE